MTDELDLHTRRIGPYTLVRQLGEGGMGIVHLAHDEQNRPVALKVMRPELARREEFRRRFQREVDAARRVARFCTAPVLDAGIDGDQAYIVTDYVEGPDLSSVVETRGPLTGAALEALAVGVATALAAIHEAGVVHRDLKPSNILLGSTGPRVIDFGIARLAEPDATQSAALVGTPAYMSPEQVNGGAVTAASDIFAWAGVVVYAGTGQPPFGTGDMPQVLYRVVNHVPRLDGVDERLRPLVEQALDKDPARRPTAQELLDRLLGRTRATAVEGARTVSDAWTPSLPGLGASLPGLGASGVARWRRLRTPLLAAALAALVTAGGSLALLRPWEAADPSARDALPAGSTVTATVTATMTTAAPAGDGGDGGDASPSSAAAGPTREEAGPPPGKAVRPGTSEAGADIRFRHSSGEEIPIHVRIDSLVREGDRIRLQWTVRNDGSGDQRVSFGDLMDDGLSAEKISLILPGAAPPAFPLWEENRCVCSRWGPIDDLAPGESKRLHAVFDGVSAEVKTVGVDLAQLGLYENILVTGT
ncbi:serine/threonine-protein kinase [Planomonospora corallina]|uniref:Serine/threonine-protein kinase n=1 Tax=Planomonospora corallina TaxID=1806052 RepID=A0ABV8ICV0_9ACTN